ncbi:hypothetical protein ACN28S_67525 [Cystobacter fuscus]
MVQIALRSRGRSFCIEASGMLFTVVDNVGFRRPAGDHAVLIRDNWNDWYTFETMFTLVVYDTNGNQHDAGKVKIGEFGQTLRKPSVPSQFTALGDQFFSLGQDEDYYETLNKLAPALRDHILSALRDVAADLALFERARNERVMTVSLMRDVAEDFVRGRLSRLARGDARLTPFHFVYQFPKANEPDVSTLELAFDVIPDSMPPTNIHVLIGRNGVGKTRCLNRMTRSLVEQGADAAEVGVFSFFDDLGFGPMVSDRDGLFSSVVTVSFSAFDPFDPLVETREKPHRIPYRYIGLRPQPAQPDELPPTGPTFRPLPKTAPEPGVAASSPWNSRRAPRPQKSWPETS